MKEVPLSFQKLNKRYYNFWGDCANFAISPYAQPIAVLRKAGYVYHGEGSETDIAYRQLILGTALLIWPTFTVITCLLALTASTLALLSMPFAYGYGYVTSKDNDMRVATLV